VNSLAGSYVIRYLDARSLRSETQEPSPKAGKTKSVRKLNKEGQTYLQARLLSTSLRNSHRVHPYPKALEMLRQFLAKYSQPNPDGLTFRSRRNTPLLETNVLHDGLHPALRALGLPQAGLHAFRHGCNRTWVLSGLNLAVIGQQMGHSSAVMTARYTGKSRWQEVPKAFSRVHLENMENESRPKCFERPDTWVTVCTGHMGDTFSL
jgi:integrase